MIYLLEDDDSIRKLVVYTLESQGYKAVGFSRPSAFWHAMEANTPELVLLDIMLPEEDGLSILRRLRASGSSKNIPVIMLTAKNSEYDRVIGLDNGADDFISKPFGMMELVARVRAVLRRFRPTEEAAADYTIGELYVCPKNISLQYRARKLLSLTRSLNFSVCCWITVAAYSPAILLWTGYGTATLTAKTAQLTSMCAPCVPSSAMRAAA